MITFTDTQLLDDYARAGSQRSFAQLVDRHAGWIYSAALRMVGDSHLAEDVTQAVFLVLARNSRKLAKRASLNSWLFRVTRYSSLHALRSRARRERHERRAAAMMSEVSEPGVEELWEKLAPCLDESVERLRRQDREAILLRFFQRKSMAEVGAALGVSEDAAKKRVATAVGHLRNKLQKTVASSPDLLGAALLAGATQAVPIGLAARCAPAALSAAASSIIAKGTLKMLFTAQLKIAASIIVGITIVPLGVGVYLHAAGASTPPVAVAPPAANVPVAPATQPEMPASLAGLQGTWVYVSGEADGKRAPMGAAMPTLIIKDNQVHMIKNGLDTIQTIKVDDSHDPVWVDATTGNGNRPPDLGIFSIGGDELRMSYVQAGGSRPTDFTTHPGDLRQSAILKRVSHSTTLPAAPAQRMADMMTLRSVGIAIIEYAAKHGQVCPPDLGTLVRSGALKPEMLVSAEAGTVVPPGLSQDQQADWVNTHTDFAYTAANVNLRRVKTPQTIIAYDKDAGRSGSTRNILFADGHIQVMKTAQAHQAIEQIDNGNGL